MSQPGRPLVEVWPVPLGCLLVTRAGCDSYPVCTVPSDPKCLREMADGEVRGGGERTRQTDNTHGTSILHQTSNQAQSTTAREGAPFGPVWPPFLPGLACPSGMCSFVYCTFLTFLIYLYFLTSLLPSFFSCLFRFCCKTCWVSGVPIGASGTFDSIALTVCLD